MKTILFKEQWSWAGLEEQKYCWRCSLGQGMETFFFSLNLVLVSIPILKSCFQPLGGRQMLRTKLKSTSLSHLLRCIKVPMEPEPPMERDVRKNGVGTASRAWHPQGRGKMLEQGPKWGEGSSTLRRHDGNVRLSRGRCSVGLPLCGHL